MLSDLSKLNNNVIEELT